MPTVLVLGATGYIGLPFAQSLLRSGNYTVYGLARSPEKGMCRLSPRFTNRQIFQSSYRSTSTELIWEKKTADSKGILTAKTLTANEIVPLIGDLSDLNKIAGLITSVPIDIVVDTSSAYESAAPLLDTLIAVSKSRIETLAKEGHSAPKLGFVYVSGTWVRKPKIWNDPLFSCPPPRLFCMPSFPKKVSGIREFK